MSREAREAALQAAIADIEALNIENERRRKMRLENPREYNLRYHGFDIENPPKRQQSGMSDVRNMKKGGAAFPDLTGDGKVTRADILKGRGVKGFKGGGCVMKGRGGNFKGMK